MVTEGNGWSDVQEFWRSVEVIVTRDGWTTHDSYGDAATLFSELRDFGLRNMVEKIGRTSRLNRNGLRS